MYWVFSHFLHRIPVFDRSTGSEEGAARRVQELRRRGQDAFWCNTLPKHYWY